VSEEVNGKSPPRNMTVQLSTSYTDPERHNTLRHRQTAETGRQTTLWWQWPMILRQSINQSIIALMKYDKTHIMTKYVLIRVLKKHAN